MADYDDYGRRYRSRTQEPEYVQTDETFIKRGSGNPTRDMVVRSRPDDRYDNYDEPDYYPATREYNAPRRARSLRGRRSDSYYDDDDYYSDYGPRSRRYYDDNYSDDYKRPRPSRRKSKVEEVLEDFGLGGIAGAAMQKIRSKSRTRRGSSRRGSSRSSSSDRSHRRRRRSSSPGDTRKKWQQAIVAAGVAGAAEAFRSRKLEGKWTGEKGQRIATAAAAAAGMDAFLDRDPDRKNKRHIAESVIGGLVGNRVLHGARSRSASRGRSVSRSRSRSRGVVDRLRSRSRSILGRGKSRSRSRSRGFSRGRSSSRGPGVKGLAALGAAAAAGKALMDKARSKSRGRSRRSSSASSSRSDVPTRRQKYRGRESPTRGGALMRGGPSDAQMSGARGPMAGDSSSDEMLSDLEERRKKMRGKEFLTAALAGVTTIHAAHGIYSSMQASEERRKLVREGEMSPEDARKIKSKNMLQDVAAVGIAALGIKSAFSEWKEMQENRRKKHELEREKKRKKKERLKRRRQQENMLMMQPPGGPMGYGMQPAYPYQPPPPNQQNAVANVMSPNTGPAYSDGNPYAYGGGLPPPPVGGRQYQ